MWLLLSGTALALDPQPVAGEPILGLDAASLARFEAGREAFQKNPTLAEGLGPIHNATSCSACHDKPAIGGAGSGLTQASVARFGFDADTGTAGDFDPLTELGGSLLQFRTADPTAFECGERLPEGANVIVRRTSTPAFGTGLLEAIDDDDILALAAFSGGRAHWVRTLEDGTARVGRLGWKAQVATSLSFAADAALNEIGITSDLLPKDNAPNGDEVLLLDCDEAPDPEILPDGDGVPYVDALADFQRFLAPPPQTPQGGTSGEDVFEAIGCASCHHPSFTTSDDPSVEPALRGVAIRPYSDFLLHDMGTSGDGVAQGRALEREMRTAPLWGVARRQFLWHDGTAFDVDAAIQRHAGEGAEERDAYLALSTTDRLLVQEFLATLGRRELDFDDDDDVDSTDQLAFKACYGKSTSPDEPCAVADVDQDGRVGVSDARVLVAVCGGRICPP